ncbi:MAG TPA: ribonuclease HI [Candidatus Paceibacterota bacterium]|nr:ribonuclease HI [Candidatus Paceibacterota bacterium]
MLPKILIFTDGAARGNPGPAGWGAVIVHDKEVKEIGGFASNSTNNQMELTGAIKALKEVEDKDLPIELFTDSSYLINGITKWVSAWRMNEWKTKAKKEVLNRELWEQLAELVENKNIEWKYLGGHSGIVGNERCDQIATEFADGKRPVLFSGPLDKYGLDILNFNLDEEKAAQKAAARSHQRAAAYSYVSLVNGKIKTHKTWADCEKRVKGKSGAKFKKATSKEDEKEIIKEFSK